jgi:hypothetical protein
MSTSVTCIFITFFSIVAIDLGQQLNKSDQVARRFVGLRFTHRELAQAAELRS